MATVGLKRLIVNDETIQVKTGTFEIKPSGATKTAVLDDATGKVMFYTQEKTAGMVKAQVATLKSADTSKLRNLEDGEVVAELLDGSTFVGTNITQTADNSITAADGTVEYEFTGDIELK